MKFSAFYHSLPTILFLSFLGHASLALAAPKGRAGGG